MILVLADRRLRPNMFLGKKVYTHGANVQRVRVNPILGSPVGRHKQETRPRPRTDGLGLGQGQHSRFPRSPSPISAPATPYPHPQTNLTVS